MTTDSHNRFQSPANSQNSNSVSGHPLYCLWFSKIRPFLFRVTQNGKCQKRTKVKRGEFKLRGERGLGACVEKWREPTLYCLPRNPNSLQRNVAYVRSVKCSGDLPRVADAWGGGKWNVSFKIGKTGNNPEFLENIRKRHNTPKLTVHRVLKFPRKMPQMWKKTIRANQNLLATFFISFLCRGS